MLSLLSTIGSVAMTATLLGGKIGGLPSVTPKMIDLPAREVYTLPGLRSNQNSQFVLETSLPSSCYLLSKPAVRVDLEQNVILFHLEAIQKADTSCSPEPMAAVQVVSLGKLNPGKYEIREFKSLRKRAEFQVRPRVGSHDSEEYAEIESATIHNDPLGFRRMLTIQGFFKNSCSKFKNSAPGIILASNRVIEVLPALQTVEGASQCRPAKVPFIRSLAIPDDIASGKYLFRVLAADDHSLYQVDSINMDIDRSQAVVWNQSPSRERD